MRFCNTRFLGYDFLEKEGLRHLNTVNLQFQNLGLDELTIYHTTSHSLTKTGVKPLPFGFDRGCVRIGLSSPTANTLLLLLIFFLLFIIYFCYVVVQCPWNSDSVTLISSFIIIIIIITDIRPARHCAS